MSAWRCDESKGVTVVRINCAKLDAEYMQAIRAELFRLAEKIDGRKLVLDFLNVDHVDSAALGTLITLHNKLAKSGGGLVLCNLNPKIIALLELIKLDRLLTISPSAPDENAGDSVTLPTRLA